MDGHLQSYMQVSKIILSNKKKVTCKRTKINLKLIKLNTICFDKWLLYTFDICCFA